MEGDFGMKFKILVLSLLVFGMVAGFSAVSFAATTNNVMVGTSAVIHNIAPGKTDVIGSFRVYNDDADESDKIDKFILAKGISATPIPQLDIKYIAVVWDINENGTYEVGIDPILKGTSAAADIDAFYNSTPLVLEVNDITLLKGGTGVPATCTFGSAYEYLVIATIDGVGNDPITYDDDTISVILEVTNGTTATTDGKDSSGIDNGIVSVTATHLKWVNPMVQAAGPTGQTFNYLTADAGEILNAFGDNQIILEAIDDNGNRQLDFAETILIGAEDLFAGTNYDVNLAVLNIAASMSRTGGAAIAMTAGTLLSDEAGGSDANSVTSMIYTLAGAETAISLVAVSTASGLEGSTAITVNAGGAYAFTNGVNAARGIELYDTNHNGKLDRATIFFNSPILDENLNDYIPDSQPVAAGPFVPCPISAFVVANYGLVGGSAPKLAADNGGKGVRNGGLYAVTLSITEIAGATVYDTSAKPQVSYNASIGNLESATNVAPPGRNLFTTVGIGDATEYDKARPILVSIKTLDSGVKSQTANNGIVDGIELTFIENVATSNATANPGQVGAGAGPGAFAFAIVNDVVETFLISGGNVELINSAGVVTLAVKEATTTNTGFYPKLAMTQYDVANNAALKDNAGNALITDFTNSTDNFVVDKQVTDAVAAQVVTISTDDTNSNGRIDKISVEFTEDMDGHAAPNASNLKMYYYTGVSFDSGVSTFGTSGIYAATKSARGTISNKVIEFTISASAEGIYDTEATPTLLNDQLGALCDLHFKKAAVYGVGQTVPAIPLSALNDGAPPVIISAITSDEYGDGAGDAWELSSRGTDGKIDTYTVKFSEVVTTQNPSAGAAGSARSILQSFSIDNPSATDLTTAGGAGLDEIYCLEDDYAAPSFTTVAITGVDQSATLKFSFEQIKDGALWNVNTGDTGMLYDVLYASTADDYITDITGNSLEDIAAGDLDEVDGADPWVLMDGEMYDFFGKVPAPSEDNGNGDGFIDSFKLFFTENVLVADHTAISGFTVDTDVLTVLYPLGVPDAKQNTILMDIGVDSDASTDWPTWPSAPDLDADDDYIDVDGDGVEDVDDGDNLLTFTSAIFYGTNQKNAGDLGDTDVTPTINYDDTVIGDLAGNLLQSFEDLATIDKAKPVIVKALGILDKNEINLLFSEDVKIGGNTFAAASNVQSKTAFGYSNVDGAGVSAIDVTLTDIISGNASRVKIKTVGVLSASDIENDLIWILAANITDGVPGNIAVNDADGILQADPKVSIRIHIDDFDAPYVTKVESQDIDGDGWIDYFKVTFSEPIDDSSLTGYPLKDNMFTNQIFISDIAGYTIKGINLYQDAAKAKAANEINFPDVTDDAVLWVKVTERSAGAGLSGIGDTGLISAITYGGDITLIDVEETQFTAAGSAAVISDAVGPVIMSALLASATKVQITHSEDIDDATINALGYDWDLADASFDGAEELETFVTATAEVSPGVVELTLPDAKALPSGVAQTVNWGPGTMAPGVKDIAGNVGARTAGSETDLAVSVAITSVALAAPSNLVVTDMPNDNGHWFIAEFTKSASDVGSYQFYAKIPGEGDAFTWRYVAILPAPLYSDESGKISSYVPTPLNGEYTYGVLASSGTVVTGMVEAAKAGEMPVAILVEDGAARGMSLSGMAEAVGGAIDNVQPSAFATITAVDNPGSNEGVTVSWTTAGAAIVGFYGNSSYQFPIYNANTYEVYSKLKDATNYVLVGTASGGATSFNHKFNDDVRVYQYKVKAVDDYILANPDVEVVSGIRSVIAKNELEADFNSDGTVGFADFSAFASQFNMKLADSPEEFVSTFDLVENGVIEFADFSRFASLWGTSLGKVAKAVEGMPTSYVGFFMDGEIDKSSSIYYITVSIDKPAEINGFQFDIEYDASALEFVEDSVNGLVGLNLTKENDGQITVASMFIGEEFSGDVILGFKSNDLGSDIEFDIVKAMVSDLDGIVAESSNLAQYTYKAPPAVYSLSKNYPNPFNPTTTIDYSIPEAGNVELVIFNIAGQKVRTLVNHTQDAAYYKVVWDSRNDSGETLASGLYFYRIVSGDFSKIEKMTLIK